MVSLKIPNRLRGQISPEYLQILENASKDDEDLVIDNSSQEHAKVLVYLIISKAKEELKLFCGKLRQTFYGDEDLQRAIQEAVKRDVKIEIITQFAPESNDLYKLDSIKTYKLNPQLKRKGGLLNHFILADKKAFRLEQIHDDNDSHPFIAKANFNDEEMGGFLNGVFDVLKANSSEAI